MAPPPEVELCVPVVEVVLPAPEPPSPPLELLPRELVLLSQAAMASPATIINPETLTTVLMEYLERVKGASGRLAKEVLGVHGCEGG